MLGPLISGSGYHGKKGSKSRRGEMPSLAGRGDYVASQGDKSICSPSGNKHIVDSSSHAKMTLSQWGDILWHSRGLSVCQFLFFYHFFPASSMEYKGSGGRDSCLTLHSKVFSHFSLFDRARSSVRDQRPAVSVKRNCGHVFAAGYVVPLGYGHNQP